MCCSCSGSARCCSPGSRSSTSLRRKGPLFPHVGKLSKNVWLGILGAAFLISIVSFGGSSTLGFLNVIGVIAAGVYLADVRAEAQADRRRWWWVQRRAVRQVVTPDPADQHGRTSRLELTDQTLREWDATVLDSSPEGIVLDRSAFYPGGGGQPPDHGVLLWGGVQTRIVGVRKGDDLELVPAEGDPVPPVGTPVRGAVEDTRRTALMRTHSGLHLLSGVVLRDFGALVTGGNMEPLEARMDFNLPEVPEGFKDLVAQACAAEVAADRAIEVSTLPRDEAFSTHPDLIRTETNLLPAELEVVRIVDIVGLDTQADGGTHVASTSQIGRIEVVKVESKGKGFRRLRIRLVDAG